MPDRFVCGYIAGAVGGVVMALINFTAFSLGLSQTRLLDLAGIVFLGSVPATLAEQILSQLIQLEHAAVAGIVFAYLIPRIGSSHLVFKGATFGATIWLIIFGIGALYKLPLYNNISWTTVASHLLTSLLWGAAAAFVLVRLEQWDFQEGRHSSLLLAAPAYKPASDDDSELMELQEQQDKLLK